MAFGGQETGGSFSSLTTGLFSGTSAKVTSSTTLSLYPLVFSQANKNETVLRCAAAVCPGRSTGEEREESVKPRETTLSKRSEGGK